jgi:hypothetical protein
MLSVHTKLDKDPPFAKIYIFYLGKYVGFVKTSEVMRWMLRCAVDQIRARSRKKGPTAAQYGSVLLAGIDESPLDSLAEYSGHSCHD